MRTYVNQFAILEVDAEELLSVSTSPPVPILFGTGEAGEKFLDQYLDQYPELTGTYLVIPVNIIGPWEELELDKDDDS